MTTPVPYNNAEILDIAKRQKTIIWLILLSIPAYIAAVVVPFLPLVVGIISLLFIYQLAVALKETSPWLYVVLGLIPCVSVIALLVINSRATSALKTGGVHVGLMGARKADLQALAENVA
jgi:hypothetical protein